MLLQQNTFMLRQYHMSIKKICVLFLDGIFWSLTLCAEAHFLYEGLEGEGQPTCLSLTTCVEIELSLVVTIGLSSWLFWK